MRSEHDLGESRAGSLTLIADELAFDFTNTSSGREGPEHREHLRDAGDVVAWAGHARVLPAAAGARLAAWVGSEAALARDLMERALTLREAVHDIGAAFADGRVPPPSTIEAVARTHAACVAEARLIPNGKGYVWSWDPETAPIAAILGPITLSALAVISQADVGRIKRCGGRHCGWLFFDTTKNRSRRWCEMQVCGNRAKVRRFRARTV